MSDMRAGIMIKEEQPGLVHIITAKPKDNGFSQAEWTDFTDAVFTGSRPTLNAEIDEFVLPEMVLASIQLPCGISVRCELDHFTPIHNFLVDAVEAWHQDLEDQAARDYVENNVERNIKGKGKGKGNADPFFFPGPPPPGPVKSVLLLYLFNFQGLFTMTSAQKSLNVAVDLSTTHKSPTIVTRDSSRTFLMIVV